MIVLSMTNVPNKIRGDLSKWFLEIETGVYVGNASSTVRKGLWDRVCSFIGSGRAVMVWNTNNEQGYDFVVAGSNWQPQDYDGLKLLLHPINDGHVIEEKKQNVIQKSNSIYKAKFQKAGVLLHDYVVVEVVTSGDNIFDNELLEIWVLKIKNHKPIDCLQILINHREKVSMEVYLTNGICKELLDKDSYQEKDAVLKFQDFVEGMPLIGFDIDFSNKFIKYVCQRNDVLFPRYKTVNVMQLAKRLLNNVHFNSLQQLANNLDIKIEALNNSDSSTVMCCYNVYEKILLLLGFDANTLN